MTGTPLPARLDELLAHREWVRRVAFALTADEHLAADLEQDVWVEALQHPPKLRGSVRGWMAATLRHDLFDRRRADARRVRREQIVARPESGACAEDVIDDAEAHRRVVNAVMDLAEPYRSALLSRYYEDQTPAVMAARLGVPVETVRTRLKRGVQQLREKFDAESGGDRSAWTLALMPLVRSPGTAAAPAGTAGTAAVGGTVMKISTPILVATALLAVCGIKWVRDLTLVAGTPLVVDEKLTPAATLRLRVKDGQGRAVVGRLFLGISPKDRNAGYGVTSVGTSVTADDVGVATYRQIVPGSYKLRVKSGEGDPAEVEAEVQAGENTVDVTLK